MKRRKLRKQVKVGLVAVCCGLGCWLINAGMNFNEVEALQNEETVVNVSVASQDNTSACSFDYYAFNEKLVGVLMFDNTDGYYCLPFVDSSSSSQSEYWMSHDIYGNVNSLGVAFVDEVTSLALNGNHWLINGHSSYKDTRGFTFLKHYSESDYFLENQIITIENSIAYLDYEILFFASYDSTDTASYTALWYQETLTQDTVEQIYQDDMDVFINYRDYDTSNKLNRYITLLTCDMENEETRYVLFAHLKKVRGKVNE